jgi:serine/threonine protein kinase
LGSGGAGSVYLAVHKHELVAVKKLHNPDLENERNEFIMEMRLLAELDSAFIIRYLGGSLTDNILVTEFMQNGDLRYALMTQNPIVSWDNRGASILLDIARGLAFLHGQRFIHRDLKSPNILLSSDFRAKLADVGIARALAPGKNQIDTLSIKFSLRWASPENFTNEDYTILTDRSDVYSFGVIMWEVMAQKMPWDHIRWEYEICNLVKAGQHNPIPENCPPRVASLMKSCWALNPDDRPSAQQIVTELEDIMLSSPPLEPIENLVLRFTGSSRDGDPRLGPDGNLILKEGTLSLRSVWLQMWHIRYFTLTTRNIIYWTYQNNQKAREIRISLFKLRKTKYYRNTSTKDGCLFEFVTFSRTYTLIARNAAEAADWVAAIELAKGNTTSTRDTVMADASDHPDPSKAIEGFDSSRPGSSKMGRPKASTLRPKASRPTASSSSSSANNAGSVKLKEAKPAAKTMRPAKGPEAASSSSGSSSKFSFFPRRKATKGVMPPQPLLLFPQPLDDESPALTFDSEISSVSGSQPPSPTVSPPSTSPKWSAANVNGSVRFDPSSTKLESAMGSSRDTKPHSHGGKHVHGSSSSSSSTYSGHGHGGVESPPASLFVSKSAPGGPSVHSTIIAARRPIHSHPEPFTPPIINEIEVVQEERVPSIESNEEEVTEIGIPDAVIGSLNAQVDISQNPPHHFSKVQLEMIKTGTMTSRNGDILTACYYFADEHHNQPPPIVLNLSGVQDYTELFEKVYDGFLQQLDGKGFSLWSKLVGAAEEYEILEAEFEDWKECIARVDRITVKSMSTPRLVIGDNDRSDQIFRRSVRMSVPVNFSADWKKMLANGLPK